MEGSDERELRVFLEEKIASGHGMVERLRLVGGIDGIDKLIRKIQQEIKFLEKVRHKRRTRPLRFPDFFLLTVEIASNYLIIRDTVYFVIETHTYTYTYISTSVLCAYSIRALSKAYI